MPSDTASEIPSDIPSVVPSDVPSVIPSSVPSDEPSNTPSLSSFPSFEPSDQPSVCVDENPWEVGGSSFFAGLTCDDIKNRFEQGWCNIIMEVDDG